MSDRELPVGVVQMCSTRDVIRNLKDAASLIREAHARGALFIATPEMTNILDMDRERVRRSVGTEEADASVRFFSALADELGVHLLIGSLALASSRGGLVNRSLLFDGRGRIVARYDKIHMFDVELGDAAFRESRSYEAGSSLSIVDLPWGKLGLTICYDIRFPQVYRTLARAGACFLSVPSAFTRVTGEAHWDVLMRARAIENGAFIIAPAQAGRHECGRESHGHSLIVDPWGQVLAEGGKEPALLLGTLRACLAEEARQRIPSTFTVQGQLAPMISSRLMEKP
jgi:predicted amidohydrolase